MKLIAQLNSNDLINHENRSFIDYFAKYKIDSIAVFIQKGLDNVLYISEKSSLLDLDLEKYVTFEEFCSYLSKSDDCLFVQCILMAPGLEMDIKKIAIKHDVFDLIYYSGKVNPIYISKWNRDKIFYNIDNSLPRIYNIDSIKDAHLEVINYFCRKYSVDTVLLKMDYCTKNVNKWCSINGIDLAVKDIKSPEEISWCEQSGVRYVNASLETILAYQKNYKGQEVYRQTF